MTATRVASVITFYQDDDFFPEALASVLQQTRAADEIIVVDDASAPERATTLSAVGPSVRVLRQARNGGAGAARQVGTEAATAELIAYLDADDIWQPTKLARQVEHLDANPELAAVHVGVVRFTRDGVETPFLGKPSLLDLPTQLRRNQALPSALMVRRDALMAVGGWSTDRGVMEDWELMIRLVAAGYGVGFLPEPLVRFRRWGHGNLSSRGLRHVRCNLGTVHAHRATYLRTIGVRGTLGVVGRVVHDEGCRRGGPSGMTMRTLGALLGHRPRGVMRRA